jgi:hypothetical protein
MNVHNNVRRVFETFDDVDVDAVMALLADLPSGRLSFLISLGAVRLNYRGPGQPEITHYEIPAKPPTWESFDASI